MTVVISNHGTPLGKDEIASVAVAKLNTHFTGELVVGTGVQDAKHEASRFLFRGVDEFTSD